MASSEASVTRRVYFFRVAHFAEFKDRLTGAFERIENLPFTDAGRYQYDPVTRSRLSGLPDTLNYPLRLRFGRTRRDSLPDIEREGQLKTLELQEDEGLIDVCHVIIFEDGHVAAEFNHDGPRLSKLGAYLFEKGEGLPSAPKFLPLFERDIVEVVSQLDSVRAIEIDVPPDAVELIREADQNLAAAVEATARAGATKRVGLTLTAESGTTTLRNVASKLAGLVKSKPLERDRLNVIKATGFSDGVSVPRYVDILEDKLVVAELFPRTSQRSRSIDREVAYKLIEKAYRDRRSKLVNAAVANEPW